MPPVNALPIDAVLPELLQALSLSNVAVLEAPPGTGKTTRVPLALLKAAWLGDKRIVMLEPRRLAARSAATYMASLLGEPVGQTVGYRTRLDTRVGRATRIEVVTEGILARLLREDAELSAYGAVIFDEFHERSLQADLGLALVRDCQTGLREELRILVMSATLDAAPLVRLLDGAPELRCPGQTFPVELRYRPPGRRPWLEHMRGVILEAVAGETGSILAFLPGEGEIRRLAESLEGQLPAEVKLCPLYGQLSAESQDEAIRPAEPGRRKLVLATSIAETSLTIDGVRVVVDSGLLRTPEYDPNTGMSRLVTKTLSAANAEQRRGRAGRLEPGICIRLWSEEEQARLLPFAEAEIQQADLAGTVLELAAWGVRDPGALAWLDQPPAPAWAAARELLQWLGALDHSFAITAHGRAMLSLGLPPRLGHMLLRGREAGQGRLAAELAALLSERDLLNREAGTDVHERVLLLRGEKSFPGVDRGRLRLVREAARRLIRPEDEKAPASLDALGRLLALAYPDHIAQRRPGGEPRYRLSNGRGALLAPEDALAGQAFIVAAHLDGQAREARVFLGASIAQAEIEALMAGQIRREPELLWDSAQGAVIAREQRRLGALVLDEKALPKPAPEVLLPVFLQGLREAGLQALPWTDGLRQWQARLELMQGLEPESWPDVGEAALLASLADWAGPYLAGYSRLGQLSGFPLHDALTGLLDWQQQQALNRLLPPSLVVPSGSVVGIDYCAEHGPVLAVKLQEMFGLSQTPRLAEGRISLLIHLLSPARRPVAVTADLASFWQNAYTEVRKDLRGRYPKHPWPDDPWTATATHRAKPRPR